MWTIVLMLAAASAGCILGLLLAALAVSAKHADLALGDHDDDTATLDGCWRCHGSGQVWSTTMEGWRDCGICLGTGVGDEYA